MTVPNHSSDQRRGLPHACLLAAAMLFAGQAIAQATKPVSGGRSLVKLSIDLDGTVLTATLDESEAVKSFVAQLPLSVTLKDYASTEKIADMPRKLSTQGSPPGYKPSRGDIAYYAPWGNMALFYKDFSYSTGLVRLGRFDGDIAALQKPGPIKATFRLSE